MRSNYYRVGNLSGATRVLPDGPIEQGAAMARLKFPKPVAVVDCNFIQGCRGESDDVPRAWDCLIIPNLLAELATKTESDRNFLFGRLSKWIQRNGVRLWMSRGLGELEKKRESAPDRV